MNLVKILTITALLADLSTASVVRRSTKSLENLAGGGYSSSTQQLTTQKCFNAVSHTRKEQAYLELNAAVPFSDLETRLGASGNIDGSYKMFSRDPKTTYLRSLQDQEYSTSFHYYSKYSRTVVVTVNGFGEEALTSNGKAAYQNGKNPLFALICGDHYITSYEQGALLLLGINIIFKNAQEKHEFDRLNGNALGNVVSKLATVKDTLSKHNTTATVIVQAFQEGGEPSKLSKILDKNSDDQYYVLSCSLSEVDNCKKAANGLLSYAENFSNQFSFEEDRGLTPLGVEFTEFKPISHLDLDCESQHNQAVQKTRRELADRLREGRYYQQKLHPLLSNGYPVKLDGKFLAAARALVDKADHNVRILMQPHGGALDCFNHPDNCGNKTAAAIRSQLIAITADDLRFVENIKYDVVATIRGSKTYTSKLISKGKNEPWWNIIADAFLVQNVASVRFHITTNTRLMFVVTMESMDETKFDGLSMDGTEYSGDLYYRKKGSEDWELDEDTYIYAKRKSPFYFEDYNTAKRQ